MAAPPLARRRPAPRNSGFRIPFLSGPRPTARPTQPAPRPTTGPSGRANPRPRPGIYPFDPNRFRKGINTLRGQGNDHRPGMELRRLRGAETKGELREEARQAQVLETTRQAAFQELLRSLPDRETVPGKNPRSAMQEFLPPLQEFIEKGEVTPGEVYRELIGFFETHLPRSVQNPQRVATIMRVLYPDEKQYHFVRRVA